MADAHEHQHDHSSCGHAHAHTHAPHVCTHSSLATHDAAHDALCIQNVSFSYGEVEALRNITLHIDRGCNLGIIGPNGGGKTTLLKIILGLLDGYSGKVSVMGLGPRDVCKRGDIVGYVPQRHGFESRFPVSVRQVVRMGLVGKTGLLRRHKKEDLDRVEQLLTQVDIAHLAERPIGELSGGNQQRAFIARALAAGPKILLLDEPMVGIDVAGQEMFADLIRGLQEQWGLTVVIVSHDLRAIAATCERVACLAQTLHYHDSPKGLTPEILQEVFRHEIEPVLHAASNQ
jgi:zinc transport system ATP-binding protein